MLNAAARCRVVHCQESIQVLLCICCGWLCAQSPGSEGVTHDASNSVTLLIYVRLQGGVDRRCLSAICEHLPLVDEELRFVTFLGRNLLVGLLLPTLCIFSANRGHTCHLLQTSTTDPLTSVQLMVCLTYAPAMACLVLIGEDAGGTFKHCMVENVKGNWCLLGGSA